MVRAALFVTLFTTLAAPALAEGGDACARFSDALAYNACLALHGPQARATRSAPAMASSGAATSKSRRHAHAKLDLIRDSRGRVSAVFDVGAATRK